MDVAMLYKHPRLLRRVQSDVQRQRMQGDDGSVSSNGMVDEVSSEASMALLDDLETSPPSPVASTMYRLPPQLVMPRTPSAVQHTSVHDDDDDTGSSHGSHLQRSNSTITAKQNDSKQMNHRRSMSLRQTSTASLSSTSASSTMTAKKKKTAATSKRAKPFVPRYHSDIQYRTALARSASSSSLSSAGSTASSHASRGGLEASSAKSVVRSDEEAAGMQLSGSTATPPEEAFFTAPATPPSRRRRHARDYSASHPKTDPTHHKKYQAYGDQDVWVQRFYMNKSLNPILYYRSVHTGRCVRHEPPTGASKVVYLEDLAASPQYVETALSPLDARSKEHLRSAHDDKPAQRRRLSFWSPRRKGK